MTRKTSRARCVLQEGGFETRPYTPLHSSLLLEIPVCSACVMMDAGGSPRNSWQELPLPGPAQRRSAVADLRH
jgi:hypothetical protein